MSLPSSRALPYPPSLSRACGQAREPAPGASLRHKKKVCESEHKNRCVGGCLDVLGGVWVCVWMLGGGNASPAALFTWSEPPTPGHVAHELFITATLLIFFLSPCCRAKCQRKGWCYRVYRCLFTDNIILSEQTRCVCVS